MCENPITIINKGTGEEITVKCGKCIICRKKKCREWALKLYHESQYHQKMCMVTLTFSTKFLFCGKRKILTKNKTRKNNGQTIRWYEKYITRINPGYITNVKKTGWLVTLFIKKLRRKLEDKDISYFAVGEHGTKKTHRAHWHIIFFGIDKNDLEAINIGKSKKNKEIYYSKIIEDKWSFENEKIGKHTISDITTATIKYVANYTMKKLYNENNEKYVTTMRFSNQNKIGIKWARRYHKELRKPYLTDNDNLKYAIPEQYYKEMTRYEEYEENNSMTKTATIIEENKIEKINRLKEKGLITREEMRKKAEKLRNLQKLSDRDFE